MSSTILVSLESDDTVGGGGAEVDAPIVVVANRRDELAKELKADEVQ